MDRSAYDVYFELDQKHFWRIGKRRLVLRMIRQYLSTSGSLRVLDIGGSCSLITQSLEAFGTVTCVEPDEATATIAHDRLGVHVVPGSLPDRLPTEQPYDLITLLDVLEHVEEDRESLASIFRLLAPGGWFVCTVPAYMWLWSDHDVSLHHKRRYTRSGLKTLLKQAGFQLQRATYYTTLLFPVVAAERLAKRLRPQPKDKTVYRVHLPPRPINSILHAVMGTERGLLRMMNLPFGSSILAVCRKPVQ